MFFTGYFKKVSERMDEEELKEEGYENIIKYGISFYRKDCVIKVKE